MSELFDYTPATITTAGCRGRDGQCVLLNEIRFRKRMTTADAVKLIGKTAPATLLVLARRKQIRVIRRGLYASI